MKNNTFTKKELIIIILLVIFLYVIKAILPLLIILGIVLYIKAKRRVKIEQKPQKKHTQIDTLDRDSIQALKVECEDMLENERQLRQEADLRQFQGRTDVTKEELATYMWEQRYWDGIHERHVHMEEIIKVCNLTMDDIKWVENELQHYHPNKNNPDFTLDNRCCYVRDTEEQAVHEYKNQQNTDWIMQEIANEEHRYKKEADFLKEIGLDGILDTHKQGHDKLMNTYNESLRKYDYDKWLIQKGYTNE